MSSISSWARDGTYRSLAFSLPAMQFMSVLFCGGLRLYACTVIALIVDLIQPRRTWEESLSEGCLHQVSL